MLGFLFFSPLFYVRNNFGLLSPWLFWSFFFFPSLLPNNRTRPAFIHYVILRGRSPTSVRSWRRMRQELEEEQWGWRRLTQRWAVGSRDTLLLPINACPNWAPPLCSLHGYRLGKTKPGPCWVPRPLLPPQGQKSQCLGPKQLVPRRCPSRDGAPKLGLPQVCPRTWWWPWGSPLFAVDHVYAGETASTAFHWCQHTKYKQLLINFLLNWQYGGGSALTQGKKNLSSLSLHLSLSFSLLFFKRIG